MYFITNIKNGYKDYLNFTGRSTRTEYWLFALYFIIVLSITCLIDIFAILSDFNLGFFPLATIIFVMSSLLPMISIGVRRLRDAGFSPYLYLLPVAFSLLDFITLYVLSDISNSNTFDLHMIARNIFNFLKIASNILILILSCFPSKPANKPIETTE